MTPTNASPELRPKTATEDSDSEFEVVAGGGKGQGSGLRVVSAEFATHPEADQEHDDEIDEQRNGDAQNVEGGV